MQEHKIENEILIRRPQQEVYQYVSQPWRWHEWHPASESATRALKELKEGDRFEETVSMQPSGLIPIRIRRRLQWVVKASRPPMMLELHGTSKIINVRVRYELDATAETRFRRTFHYSVKGWLRFIERFFVLPRMQQQSAVALENLKRALESQARPHP